MGVAQVINKSGGDEPFSRNDEKVFRYDSIEARTIPNTYDIEAFMMNFLLYCDITFYSKYLQFCGVGLRNAQLYERSQLEVRRNQVLLDLAGVIFQEQSTIDNMIDRILTHMVSLIRYIFCKMPKHKYQKSTCYIESIFSFVLQP